MTAPQAAWLGSWKQPWDLGYGRRWGHPVWALASIAQAWMLGGCEGRWPLVSGELARSRATGSAAGSALDQLPRGPRPDPTWVALLRHGSPKLSAQQPKPREDELRIWCWDALLRGDGSPWMALGSVLLSLETRLRWVAPLGMVDAEGRLVLPPFLDDLVPQSLKALPAGWWVRLLGGGLKDGSVGLDGEGRLLPEGPPPRELHLLGDETRPFLEPLALKEAPPEVLLPWAVEREGFWILDPHLRAWTRGAGASIQGLADLTLPSLARGDAPEPLIAEILAGEIQGATPCPDGWASALDADLHGQTMEFPPPSGDPVLDRIRMRWGGEAPAPIPGYPCWGESAHACADPFHWMAEGRRAYFAQDMEAALRAFTWAHAHFTRLCSAFWAERAAANAATAALFWGDLRALGAWRRILGPEPSPYQEHSEALLHAVQGEWDEALSLARRTAREHDFQSAWVLLAQRAMQTNQPDKVAEELAEILPHLAPSPFRDLVQAWLGGMAQPSPEGLDPETLLAWELHRVLRQRVDAKAFWVAWERCSNHPMRLNCALDLLEARPEERSLARLLRLQTLADRMGAPRLQARVNLLWPYPETEAPLEVESLVRDQLARLGHPVWIAWDGRSEALGFGEPPPEGALPRLRQAGHLPPFQAEGATGSWIWRGFPIRWEGHPVASALIGCRPEASLGEPSTFMDLHLLAPWLALMHPAAPESEPPLEGELLADGSEPMVGVLRDMNRVAASELSVLILGPTGSGKELVAKALHRASGRLGPLVPVNISAFGEGVLESELFGHVKGAFTGAERDRKGAIELAEGGTLFMDEIADLSPRLQSLLLRVLQDREVRRVGSERSRAVNVRFLAATHKSLEQLAVAGGFRRDLLFRLQGAVLELPSLDARRHEFPYLVPRLVAQAAREAKRPCPDIAAGLPQALSRLAWPGNFRELRHAIQRALLRCGDGMLAPHHFPELDRRISTVRSWETATRDFQRGLLMEALIAQDFQVTEAARALDLTRPALYLAAKRLGLDLVAERAKHNSKFVGDPGSA
ncbi:MAG TPA: sigma 54-interacting transcriptional regulator [Holophaga sp.]|nr:sigma 54-interacting transcriptional regulator [Holophaga sp.]